MPVVIGDPAFDATKVAPSEATFITLSVNTTLTDERVLTGTSNQIVLTDNGAGSTIVLSLPQDIATDSSPIFATPIVTGLTIGANTLTTSEWANLDGIDQTLATSSSPTFAGLTIDNINLNGSTITH